MLKIWLEHGEWEACFSECGHLTECSLTAVWQAQTTGVFWKEGSWYKDWARGDSHNKRTPAPRAESWVRMGESRRGARDAETRGQRWRKEDSRRQLASGSQKWGWLTRQDCPDRGHWCRSYRCKKPAPEKKEAQGGLSAGVHTPHKPDIYPRRECLACPLSALTWQSWVSIFNQ